MSQLQRSIQGTPARYRYIWVAGYVEATVTSGVTPEEKVSRIEQALRALADVQVGVLPDALDAVKASGELAGMSDTDGWTGPSDV